MEITIDKKSINQFIYGLVIISLALVVYNSYMIYGLNSVSGEISKGGGGGVLTGGAVSSIIPQGSPKIYGPELGVSFDSVSAYDPAAADQTIATLGNLDRTITLSAAQNERYVGILFDMQGGISCEYCCGAKSVIFESGEAACGCAHSFAMRGLTKYLITEHGDEYSDAEIFEEVAKWKVLFFPTQMSQKADIMKEQGIETSYANVGGNTYRGIEKGASGGGMVGGC